MMAEKNVDIDEYSTRFTTKRTEKNIRYVHADMRGNRRINSCDFTEDVQMSCGSIHSIITEDLTEDVQMSSGSIHSIITKDLYMKRVSAMFMAKRFSAESKKHSDFNCT